MYFLKIPLFVGNRQWFFSESEVLFLVIGSVGSLGQCVFFGGESVVFSEGVGVGLQNIKSVFMFVENLRFTFRRKLTPGAENLHRAPKKTYTNRKIYQRFAKNVTTDSQETLVSI